MSMHEVEFTFNTPEYGSMDIDLDPALDKAELEDISLREIKEIYDDVVDIEITKIREV